MRAQTQGSGDRRRATASAARLAALAWLGTAAVLAATHPLPAPAQQAGAGAAAAAVPADATPVGLWKTIDDETKQPKALVRVSEQAGVLSGRIEKLFDPSNPNPVCEACTDDRKDRPIVGMTIVTGVKKFDDHWGDGKILDPKTGKIYSVRMTPVDGGRKLEVRGFIGFALLGRTQTWLREP